jgi:hypothetical protein
MLMKCISMEEGIWLLRDIQSDICRSHSSWCPIISNAFRHKFYWPTTKDDAMEVVIKCKYCQFFQKWTTKHANPLWTIDLSWPFTIWGCKYLFVAIDTFTKCMEAISMVNIMQDAAVRFLQCIIFRYGVPWWVLTDNGT